MAPAGYSAELRHDIEFRRDLGFQANVDHVQRLRSAALAGDSDIRLDLGVPLTESELREVDERNRTVDDDATTVRRVLSGFGDDVAAGFVMDNLAGGLLTVMVTRDEARIREALEPLVKHQDRLRVVHATNSLQELTRVKDEVFASRTELASYGVAVEMTKIDEPRNKAVAVVSSELKTARAVLQETYGSSVIDVEAGAAPQAAGTQFVNSPPFAGGQQIRYVGDGGLSGSCTLGFIAYRVEPDNGSTQYFALTAGHCGLRGQFFQGDVVPIGRMYDRDFSNNSMADSLAISIELSGARSHLVLPGPISTSSPERALSNNVVLSCSLYLAECQYRDIFSVQPQGGDVVGQVTCHSGINVSGLECGEIKATSLDYQFVDPFDPETIGVFHYGREAAMKCELGDSGGPVLYGSQARGIVSAIRTDSFFDRCIYGHIYDNVTGLNIDGIVTWEI